MKKRELTCELGLEKEIKGSQQMECCAFYMFSLLVTHGLLN